MKRFVLLCRWCGPCKLLGPRLESLISSKSGSVLMAKVNIDENSDLALDHGVRFYYRPQRSCKVMFLHLSVILSTGGGGLWQTPPLPKQTATTTDGTPPTGMYSCRFYFQYFIDAGDGHYIPTYKSMVRSREVNNTITSSPGNSLVHNLLK